jgi:hypothetical protein
MGRNDDGGDGKMGVGDDPRRGEVQRIFPGYHHQPD